MWRASQSRTSEKNGSVAASSSHGVVAAPLELSSPPETSARPRRALVGSSPSSPYECLPRAQHTVCPESSSGAEITLVACRQGYPRPIPLRQSASVRRSWWGRSTLCPPPRTLPCPEQCHWAPAAPVDSTWHQRDRLPR